MSRQHADWIEGFLKYASHTEAPKHMHFWTAVSTVAGALRRKVWLDMAYFKWHPNFYICLVAPPGIVSKSTTASLGMDLLRQVEGITFGPDVVTWPALLDRFEDAHTAFEYPAGTWNPMSAMTLESSEFGNLLNPQDKQMVDLYVSLWDGKQGSFTKSTKTSGQNAVENPWINLIACTTPSWIAGNFPEYMIGGGFTSRTIFVYADQKRHYVAYPDDHVPADLEAQRSSLVADLQHIATNLTGPFTLTKEAKQWGREWYKGHYTVRPEHLDDDRFGGYIARKQTHIHKLAMVLSAAKDDSMQITAEQLMTANQMVTDLEPDMPMVFSKIGQSDTSVYITRLIHFVHARGMVEFSEAYRYVHMYFPAHRDFEDAISGCVRAGYLKLQQHGSEMRLVAGKPLVPTAPLPETKATSSP